MSDRKRRDGRHTTSFISLNQLKCRLHLLSKPCSPHSNAVGGWEWRSMVTALRQDQPCPRGPSTDITWRSPLSQKGKWTFVLILCPGNHPTYVWWPVQWECHHVLWLQRVLARHWTSGLGLLNMVSSLIEPIRHQHWERKKILEFDDQVAMGNKIHL